ncbi:MAG: DNA repair protein RadA [Bacteroidales bacterium]|nr:DNA repair protein RadA [Bacteroidales bacterium]MBS3774568.1 DNA repair protein RadA [Bacteroidales bacterium]
MAKKKNIYICQNCGAESSKWLGRCPYCNEWNTYVEETIQPEGKNTGFSDKTADIQPLSTISLDDEKRLSTHYSEVDRVLGGGMVPGSLVLVGGEPGIGKSTLALQMALKSKGVKVLYISGEESLKQLKLRSDRLKADDNEIYLLNETSLERVLEQAKQFSPDLLIVDSIQTLFSENFDSAPGSVSQVRQSATRLLYFAKSTSIPVLVIGHINKEGSIAGPKVLEHIVDVVLQFEGDHNYVYRVLRALKNRFGSTSELGIFEMSQSGLEEVLNPSKHLVNQYHNDLSGVAIASTIDGIRPFLVEIQSLVSPASYGTPQRTSTGFDARRLSMLLAVLEKRAGVSLFNKDVFLNLAGGIKVVDPAIDLAIVSSILSSFIDKPVDMKTCFTGEVGLSGEIRAVTQIEKRVQEADKLGYKRMFLSEYNSIQSDKARIGLEYVNTVGQLFYKLFGGSNE